MFVNNNALGTFFVLRDEKILIVSFISIHLIVKKIF